jgi:hypothetical protein
VESLTSSDTFIVTAAKASHYPDLLDVDAEELVAGLESGAWTSVDLTKVNFHLERIMKFL